jgi:hypothetical protein
MRLSARLGQQGEFITCLISHLGMSVPLWQTLDTRTDIAACDVTEVIAEHCDTHHTGLLLPTIPPPLSH